MLAEVGVTLFPTDQCFPIWVTDLQKRLRNYLLQSPASAKLPGSRLPGGYEGRRWGAGHPQRRPQRAAEKAGSAPYMPWVGGDTALPRAGLPPPHEPQVGTSQNCPTAPLSQVCFRVPAYQDLPLSSPISVPHPHFFFIYFAFGEVIGGAQGSSQLCTLGTHCWQALLGLGMLDETWCHLSAPHLPYTHPPFLAQTERPLLPLRSWPRSGTWSTWF